MNTELDSSFDHFDKTPIIRRELLPWWIKIFCWLFMIMSFCAIGAVVTNLFMPTVDLSLYGFSSNTAFSGIGIFIIVTILIKGFAAYSLWFEKDNAILVGKIDAIYGFLICLFSMFILPFFVESNHIQIRLEIILIILFYIKLNKIEYEWDNLESI